MALEEFQVNYMYISIYQTESHHVKSKRVLSIKAWINQSYIWKPIEQKMYCHKVWKYNYKTVYTDNFSVWSYFLCLHLRFWDKTDFFSLDTLLVTLNN